MFTVKSNQPTLYAACKKLPWADVPAHTAVTSGHGRRARRTIKVVTALGWISFTGATQIAQTRRTRHLRRTGTRHGRTSVEGRLCHHLRRPHRRTGSEPRGLESKATGHR